MIDCDASAFPPDDGLEKLAPLFYVQPAPPIPVREAKNQATFLSVMRRLAPSVTIWATPNAGKRGLKAQAQIKREGVVSGVHDLCLSAPGRFGVLEFKGHAFPKVGKPRAGKLSQSQIAFGNLMLAHGHWVACYFDPWAAVDALRRDGWPVKADH
jgi:hypothetical protein